MAFLALLERLAPEERAAFLLHEVFDSGYDDIARILGKSEPACRQIVSRARKRVREAQPRVQVSAEARTRLLQGLVEAVQAQDQPALLKLLSDDATLDLRRRRQGEGRQENRARRGARGALRDRRLSPTPVTDHFPSRDGER